MIIPNGGGYGGFDWWCALPDVDFVAAPAAELNEKGRVLARYQSGRPWIMGSATTGFEVVPLGSARVAVIGECLADAAQLTASAARGLDDVMALPGSFYALMTTSGGFTAAGDVSGFRRIFTTNTNPPVVCSHADVARTFTGGWVDPVWLACKLASPEAPSVVRDARSPFSGVTPVPTGSRVEVSPATCRIHRWWMAPAPTLTCSEGADALREALTAAVVRRTERAAGLVSVQLSGGLDSTVLAYLAEPSEPLLISTVGRSSIDDDFRWSTNVATALHGSEYRPIFADEAPEFFAGLTDPAPRLDEPPSFAAGRARQQYTAGLLAAEGSALNLNGQGGDEVLLAPLAYLRPALRAAPGTGLRHLRGHAALGNIPTSDLVRAVAHRESFGAWLRSSADTLRTEQPIARAATGWEAPPLLPPWSSSHAVDLVRSAILDAEPATAADDQTTHAALVRIRASAYRAALYRDAMQAAGVPTSMPFFDRSVVEACLAVLPWQRTDPWQPKPLLRNAFRQDVPPRNLSRRTKGDYNADIHHGWQRHRHAVSELLAEPALTSYDFIDPARLRQTLDAFGPSGLTPAWVTDLIAIETWLRQQPS